MAGHPPMGSGYQRPGETKPEKGYSYKCLQVGTQAILTEYGLPQATLLNPESLTA